MSKHCAKHDVLHGDNEKCWNCEEQELGENREQTYADPEFIARRAGGGQATIKTAKENAAIKQWLELSDEERGNLVALAKGGKAPTPPPPAKETAKPAART